MLGQGNLRGDEEEDVGLEVYHGLLLGHLGRVLGPGRSVDGKGGIGTSEPLGDGESFDQLEEVLPTGTEPSLDPPPSASGRGPAPHPTEGRRRPSPPSGAEGLTLLGPSGTALALHPPYSVTVCLSLSMAGISMVAKM